jgi:hypothetical protein
MTKRSKKAPKRGRYVDAGKRTEATFLGPKAVEKVRRARRKAR